MQYFCTSDSFTTSINDWEQVNIENGLKQLDEEINGITIDYLDIVIGKGYSTTGYFNNSKYAVSKVIPAGKITISATASQTAYTARLYKFISSNEGEKISQYLTFSTPLTFESTGETILTFRKNAGEDDLTNDDKTAIEQLFNVTYDNSTSIQGQLNALKSAGYLFKGVADMTTNPGIPNEKIFYLASKIGTYTNFNNIELNNEDGVVALCYDNSQWSKLILDIAANLIKINDSMIPNGEVPSSYVSSNGDLGTLSNSKVVYHKVTKGDVITLTISNAVGSSNYAWALYSNLPLSSTSFISKGPASNQANGTHTVLIEHDGYLARTILEAGTYSISGLIYKNVDDFIVSLKTSINNIEEREQKTTPALRYNITDNVLKVAQGYGNNDLVIKMQKRGGNELFDFSGLYTIEKGGVIGVATETTILPISTDWHAPFQIAALNNIDGDDINADTHNYNKTFTGGNHQYNNTRSGSTPTARTSVLSFFVNGNNIIQGYGFADVIEVRWTNLIQGYNTKKEDGTGREILKENHRMIFNADGVKEFVELIPLEGVSIEKWYGFQFSGRASIYPNVLFVNAVNKGVITTSAGSGQKDTSNVIGYGETHKVKMSVDISIDLGQRYGLTAVNGAITAGDNKAYFVIIDNLSVNEGEHYFLEGGWEFSNI